MEEAALWKEQRRSGRGRNHLGSRQCLVSNYNELMRSGELEGQASASPSARRIWLVGHISSPVGDINTLLARGIHCPWSGASSFLTSPWVQRFVSRLCSVAGLSRGNLKSSPYLVQGNTHSPAENGKSKPGNPPGMSVHRSRDEFIAALEGQVIPHGCERNQRERCKRWGKRRCLFISVLFQI